MSAPPRTPPPSQPNYGTDVYWLGGPPAKSMMDTSGIPDSLPLTSLSMDTALLQWGLFDSALAKVGFYFDTFIFPNGTAGPPPPAAHARLVSSLDSTTGIAEIATRCK